VKHPHRSPKRFFPPKAWRSRDRHPSTIYAQEILKEYWPAGGGITTPGWATDCFDRHWMTWAQLQRVPKVPNSLLVFYEALPDPREKRVVDKDKL